MNRRTLSLLAWIVLLALTLTACSSSVAPETAPPPADTATPSSSPTPTPAPSETATPEPSPTPEPTPTPTPAPTPTPPPEPLNELDVTLLAMAEEAEPGASAYDIIAANQEGFDAIVRQGTKVIPDLFVIWDSGARDMRGQLVYALVNEILPYSNIVTKLSPGGTYRAETYGINLQSVVGGVHPAQGLRVVSHRTGEVLWSMEPGNLELAVCWEPEEQYVAFVYTTGRERLATVVDMTSLEAVALPTLPELLDFCGSTAKVHKSRPDPFYQVNSILGDILYADLSFTTESLDEGLLSFEYDLAAGKILFAESMD